MTGAFISFEGIEGTGKTTQTDLLASYLTRKGLRVTTTREPGGTAISQKIREILLSPDHAEMAPVTELLLYNAARVQHLREIILPALERGETVITDRFSDSTVAYQGYARGIDLELIDSLDLIATGRIRPDLTILLDLDVETGLSRNRKARKHDRFEAEETAFHEKVRKGFIGLAAREKDRFRVVSASGAPEEIHVEVRTAVDAFLAGRSQ